MFLCVDPEEGEVVGGVQVSDGAASLPHQLVNQPSVLHRGRVVHGATDGDAFRARGTRVGMGKVKHEITE